MNDVASGTTRIIVSALVGVIAVAWSHVAGGQLLSGGGGLTPTPPSLLLLLTEPKVQQDLRLSFRQIKHAVDAIEAEDGALAAQLKTEGPEPGNGAKAVLSKSDDRALSILNPAQVERLKQIALQLRGRHALTAADVVKELGLSKRQVERITALLDEYEPQIQEMSIAAQQGDESQAVEGSELEARLTVRLNRLVTVAQLKKWRQMIGSPFAGLSPNK